MSTAISHLCSMSSLYLDYNSTTPVDDNVLEAMLPYFSEKFGNAASATHAFGWTAAAVTERARLQVAEMIGAEPSEIIFTSGATESLNLAIRGVMEAHRQKGKHLIVCATEHKAVLDTVKDLASKDNDIAFTLLQVDREGRVDPGELERAIRKDTVLAAVMMANNETGVLQDSGLIGEICRENKVIHLSDTTQAIGKVRVDVQEHKLDLCTLSAHKLYGPKGVGALYIRRKHPRVKLVAEITGGGHENGLRSGTLNVPGIVGLGEACRLASGRLWDYGIHVSRLRTLLEQQLTRDQRGYINGSIRHRLPNTSNICFQGIRSAAFIKALPDIALSTGSACTSALAGPSHVLKAMGLSDDETAGSIRFSIGKDTTEEQIQQAIFRIGMVLDSLSGNKS